MRQRMISVILAALMCFVLCSCDAGPAATAAPAAGGAEIEETAYTGNGSAWCSALFESPATSYNNDLALVAAEMNEAAESNTGREETISDLLSSYDLYCCEYHNFDGTDLFASGGAFALGLDTLTVNGVSTTVLVVVARGTKNLREGIGDLFKGGEVDFLSTQVWKNVYDFEEKIWDGIKSYIASYPAIAAQENLKILITGHSLGGAAANLLGARFTDGIGSGEWWGDKVSKDDIYVYTFGAIKALTTETNIRTGYENIHNVYNYYDSYGPNGNQKGTNASSLNAKFGHTELYYLEYPEDGTSVLSSCNSHQMSNYKDALDRHKSDPGFIELDCAGQAGQQPEPSAGTGGPSAIQDFAIEGTWKSVGSYGFGQAQPGAIVTFDGAHCNFFSPYDTYAFYQDNGQWRLDCTSFLFAETLSFPVEIMDADLINVYYGSTCTQLRRIN